MNGKRKTEKLQRIESASLWALLGASYPIPPLADGPFLVILDFRAALTPYLEPLLLPSDDLLLTGMTSASEYTLFKLYQNQNAVKENLYFWVGPGRKQVVFTIFFLWPRHLKHSYSSCKCILVISIPLRKLKSLQHTFRFWICTVNTKRTKLKVCNLPRSASFLWSSTSLNISQCS